MAVQSDVEYFARLVDALEPWLDQVVIIGGWAHRLYRQHPLAQPLDYEPLGTLETGFAVPLDLPATASRFARGCSKGTSAKNCSATCSHRLRTTAWRAATTAFTLSF